MLSREQLETIRHLNSEQRMIFVTACAERVYDAYTYSARPPNSRFALALDLLWSMIDAQTQDQSQLTQLVDFFTQQLAALKTAEYEQGESLQYTASACLLAALRAVLYTSGEDAVQASQFLSATAARANTQSAVSITEEDAWQSAWLVWCQNADVSTAHDEFTARNEQRPQWVERMEA